LEAVHRSYRKELVPVYPAGEIIVSTAKKRPGSV